mgnify:CR=1 FL=1
MQDKPARGGARGKLRAHFLANLGRVMDSDELRAVADNQSEWARRVRELRTEEGYQILTHNDRSALKARLDIEPNNLLDLGEVLRGPGHRGTVGAKVAVAHFFGQKLQKSKKTGTSNWASAHLSERQLIYAANDAHVALRLYRAWLQASPPAN